jgi:hypothetical protein
MATYVNVNGIMMAQGSSELFPTAEDFSGGMGAPADLSLVPDLSMDTPVRYDPGPAMGAGAAQPTSQAGAISVPWLLIGGLAIVMLGLRSRR